MMVATKLKPIDHYLEKIQARLHRKYPHLHFEVVRQDDREAFIHYTPFVEAEDWDIIKMSSGIATDAMVDAGYRIWVQPAA